MLATPAATSRMSSPRRAAATETSGNENAARSPSRSYAEASGTSGRLDGDDELAGIEGEQ